MKNLSSGKNPPEQINVFVEIPQGSSIKYELDKEAEWCLWIDFSTRLSRTRSITVFVPGTQADDGDPTDVLVISSQSVAREQSFPPSPLECLKWKMKRGSIRK